ILRRSEIGHIAVDEQLAGVESDNRICRHAAIGTADPEITGRLLAFEAPEEVTILRGHTRCPGAIPLLQVVRCQSIHVFAGNKHYRVTYLVRRECCYRVPRAKANREFVARPRTEQMNPPAAIGFGRSTPGRHRPKARVGEEFGASRERPAS